MRALGNKSVAGGAILLLGTAAAASLSPSFAADKTAPLYAKMEQRFTTTAPGAATGWRFDGALKPFPAGQQVPPQRGVTFVFPRGTRIRPGAVRGCRASDERIVSEGLAACPAASRVGSGEADLFLGSAGAATVQAHVFATGRALLLVFTAESGGVLRVLRANVDRNRVSATLPAVPLPGGYELAITRFKVKMRRVGSRRRPGLATPETCPKSGRWKFVYLPRYDAPYGVQRSTSTMRCEREP